MISLITLYKRGHYFILKKRDLLSVKSNGQIQKKVYIYFIFNDYGVIHPFTNYGRGTVGKKIHYPYVFFYSQDKGWGRVVIFRTIIHSL